MASVATRRLFGRNFSKLQDFSQFTNHSRCTSVFVINFHERIKLSAQPIGHRVSPFISYNAPRYYTNDCNPKKPEKPEPEKLSLFQRFKQMYKDYWYVLVPVHVVTSTVWYGSFYYLAKSGVDVPALLESFHFSERITDPLRKSSMGYLAIAYALYKMATPVRYTVTLGGTTISINYLRKWGYIKPVPSPGRLKEIYHEKKDHLMETMRETKEGLKVQSEKLKDKKEHIIEDFDKGIKHIKEIGIKGKEHIVQEVKKKKKKE